MTDRDGVNKYSSDNPTYRLAQQLWWWLAFDGDRRIVTVTVLGFGFLVITSVSQLVGPPSVPALAEQHTMSLVSTLLSGTFFLFSIVVSVNTLYVSQQQNPLNQQLDRIQSIIEFRRKLESGMDEDHVPAEPDAFLQLLTANILERAQHLENTLRTADLELREDLDAYVTQLAEETGEMNADLDEATTTLDLVLATRDYNHDRQINDLRRLRSEYSEQLTDETDELIDEMLRLLQHFAAAREYFMTLYTRREFARLSRDLVLTAVPTAAVVASFMHFSNDLPESSVLIAGVEAIAFVPFVLVASYVLRVAVTSTHTQIGGQFVAESPAGDIEGIPREE